MVRLRLRLTFCSAAGRYAMTLADIIITGGGGTLLLFHPKWRTHHAWSSRVLVLPLNVCCVFFFGEPPSMVSLASLGSANLFGSKRSLVELSLLETPQGRHKSSPAALRKCTALQVHLAVHLPPLWAGGRGLTLQKRGHCARACAPEGCGWCTAAEF